MAHIKKPWVVAIVLIVAAIVALSVFQITRSDSEGTELANQLRYAEMQQQEAMRILREIYQYEMKFFFWNWKYWDSKHIIDGPYFNFPGYIERPDIDLPYYFSVRLKQNGFIALAITENERGLDDDETPDYWAIDETGNLQCIINDLEG